MRSFRACVIFCLIVAVVFGFVPPSSPEPVFEFTDVVVPVPDVTGVVPFGVNSAGDVVGL